jgi:hypothetical protein
MEDGTENRSNLKEEGSNDNENPNASKRVAIEGMQIVSRKQKKDMLFDTALAAEEEDNNEGSTNKHNKNTDNKDNQGDKIEGGSHNEGNNNQSKEGDKADDNGHNSKEVDNSGMEEDQDNGEGEDASGEEEEMEDSNKLARINTTMTANMISALAKLNTCSDEGEDDSLDKEGESFFDKDRSDRSGDHDLSLGEYNPDAIEVSSRIFNAEHSKKYQTPNIFLQALWNAAGPSVGSMTILLNLIKSKLEGNLAGIDPDFTKIPIQLIDFMIEEAREDPEECIAFIDNVIEKLDKYNEDNKMVAEVVQSNVRKGHTNEEAPALDKGGGPTPASKTQELLPRAQEMCLAEETVMETARMAVGDKEGA